MEKKKCMLCNQGKARRKCRKNNDELICSRCCAETRDVLCEGCQYYDQVKQYEAERSQKNRHFIIEINEELENEIDKALALMERGKHGEGGKIIENLFISHPDYYLLNYAMGVVYGLKEDNDQAIYYFEKAIDAFPYLVEAHFNLGEAYRRKLDIYNTVKSFRKVIEIGDPQDKAVISAREFVSGMEAQIMKSNGVSLDNYLKGQEIFEKAFCLLEQKEWEKAIPVFQECIKIVKNHTQSYGNLGLCYAQIGQKEKALKAFNKALEIDPNYEPALINKAAFESMKDGEISVLESVETVDYYRDYSMQNKSFTRSLIDKIFDR
ncbi:MAG: tetratricopeptide repeat protein [Deltaproteobacteria bacterium]|nr:tetratricopeptide repeat protein [Deltaproteobacteria bacterium]